MDKQLKNMSAEELDFFATDNGIDLSGASSKAQKVFAIEQALHADDPVEIEVMGMTISVKPSVMDDFELVDWMDEIASGNVMKFPKACRRIFGDDYEEITAPLKNADGVIPISRCVPFFTGIVEGLGAKNS